MPLFRESLRSYRDISMRSSISTKTLRAMVGGLRLLYVQSFVAAVAMIGLMSEFSSTIAVVPAC